MKTIDIGCDDFARAAQNRQMVKDKANDEIYQRIEQWFKKTPLGAPLPSWMPLGKLPTLEKRDWQENGGGRNNSFEIVEPFVVEVPTIPEPELDRASERGV